MLFVVETDTIRSMSTRAVVLDEQHFRVAEEKARALGKTPEQYLQSLIEADSRSFDELLQPIRQGFDSMTDAEVDSLLQQAQRAARRQRSETA